MKNKSKRWTFIVIGNNRQLGSFDITETLITTLLVIVLLLASATFAAYLLHDKGQTLAIEEIAQQLVETEAMLSDANERNAHFAALVKTFEDRLALVSSEKAKPEANKVASPPSPPPPPEIEKPSVNTVLEELPVPEASIVDISHFTIRRRDNDSISYSFRVNNIDSGNAPVSGYTFAILRSRMKDPSSWIINPKTNLVNGLPQYFKTGEYFSIQRYKTTRGRFERIPGQMKPDIITILVFSNDGKLILKKDHNI